MNSPISLHDYRGTAYVDRAGDEIAMPVVVSILDYRPALAPRFSGHPDTWAPGDSEEVDAEIRGENGAAMDPCTLNNGEHLIECAVDSYIETLEVAV